MWDTLRLLRSELLFDAGYVLVWIGLFAVARWAIPRRVVLVLLHASAILVVVISTVAYQYFRSTGTVLDYSVVAYYLAKPGEAQGAVSSDAPIGAWLVLSVALLYLVPGPLLLTRTLLVCLVRGNCRHGSLYRIVGPTPLHTSVDTAGNGPQDDGCHENPRVGP